MRRSGASFAGFLGFLSFLSAALVLAPPAIAQYLYLDSNGDGAHTAADVVSPTGNTTVDVWLNTNHNRDGSTATCVTGDGELTINSYEFILKAQHGTVTWGSFTNLMVPFTVNLGLASSGTDYHNGFGGGTIFPPGLYHVATLTITPTTGTPTIVVAASTSLNGSYLTSFGSQCSGNDFDNTMKLGSEWTDADGLPYAGALNTPPVMAQPSDMTVAAATTADQTLTATDSDGNPLTFSAIQPPLFVTVTTTNPGTGAATGNVHLAPNASDAGTRTQRIQVTDGIDTDQKQFQITVTVTHLPITLSPIPDQELLLGHQVAVQLHASDPDGNPFTFEKTTGPDFMYLVKPDFNTYIQMSPVHASDIGVWPASVTARDPYTSDTKSFTITVLAGRHPELEASGGSGYVGSFGPIYAYVYVFDPDLIPIVSLTVDASSIPPGDPTSFAVSTDNIYGLFSWIPSAPGTYPIIFRAVDETGYTVTATTSVMAFYPPPEVTTPFRIVVHPGDVVDFTVTAEDSHAPIVSLTANVDELPVPNNAVFTVNATNTEGHFTWTPQLADFARNPYFVEFDASDGTSVGGAATILAMHLADVDHLDPNRLDLLVSNAGVVGRDLDNGGGAGLFFPKGSPTTVMFSSGPWLGGFESGDLRFARGGNSPEFQIGPMANGTFQPPLERFRNFKLVKGDVTSDDYLNWPTEDGAPVDATGHPALTGDMMIWNVYNDANPSLHQSGEYANAPTAPVGVEVQQSVFSFNLPGPLANVAFEKLKLVNKGGAQVDNAYVSIYSDIDDGGFSDDLAGSDPALSMGFVYNATNTDAQFGGTTPAVGWQLLQGPALPGGPRLGLTAVQTYIGADLSSHPNTAAYGLQRGLNIDGSAMHVFDDSLSPVTTFRFNGDPVTRNGWLDHTPGDKRILVSSGPFTMPAGAEQEIVAAVCVGQGADRLVSVSELRKTARAARYLYRSGFQPLPFADAPETVTVNENAQLTLTFNAYDLDGDALTGLTADRSGLPLGNDAVFLPGQDFATGTLTWTPTYNDAGFYHVTFRASNDKSGTTVTTIRVLNTNRPPVANAGGPYSGVAGVPILFDGTGSSDPDGDALTYLWRFNDGDHGLGATIMHAYAVGGTYTVSLTVTDGAGAYGESFTTATILSSLAARAYAPAGQATIRLATPKPFNTVEIEPVNADFEVGDVDLSSIQMISPGTGSITEIGPILGKTAVVSDRDQNGVPEIQAYFGKLDLRQLFDALPPGQHDVTVALKGQVSSGARFTASLALRVIVNGTLTASISPNPMNPEAMLTFRTSREGPVRAALYDLSGRRVRTLLDAGGLAAGYHDIRIDGTNDSGGRLASGIYFVAIESPDGDLRSKVTILR